MKAFEALLSKPWLRAQPFLVGLICGTLLYQIVVKDSFKEYIINNCCLSLVSRKVKHVLF